MPVTSRAAAAGTIEAPIVEPVVPRTEPNSVLALSVAAGLLLVIVVLVLFVIAAAT
jgi:zinc transporter ZupT